LHGMKAINAYTTERWGERVKSHSARKNQGVMLNVQNEREEAGKNGGFALKKKGKKWGKLGQKN